MDSRLRDAAAEAKFDSAGRSAALERIVQRCLAIDPARRYATAGAIADDLERWLGRVELEQRLKKVAFYGVPTALVLLLAAFFFWPPTPIIRHERASREIAEKLMLHRAADLIGPKGAPETFLVRTNERLSITGATKEGRFFVDCSRPCLVELLPNAPTDHYIFSAEMRQLTGLGANDIGLYCGHSESVVDSSSEHRFMFLTFSDIGVSSNYFPGPNNIMGSGLFLRGNRYRLTEGEAADYQHIDWRWYPSSKTIPGPWRRISVTVSGVQISGNCGNVEIPLHRIDRMSDKIASPRFPRGGLGIYVNNCRVEIRNCRLTLLDPP